MKRPSIPGPTHLTKPARELDEKQLGEAVGSAGPKNTPLTIPYVH